MNLSVRFSNAKRTKHVIARAIACSMLLVLPSCGIPHLRQAEPGPGLPAELQWSDQRGKLSSARDRRVFQ